MTEPRALATSSGVPRATIWPPNSPAAGAEVEQLIGGGDHFAVVLDHQQRVAQVAQLFQRRRAAGDCRAGAGRSSARRAHTARRTGRCRPGWPGECAALRRRRASGPAATEREIFQADVDQELQPIANFAEQLAGDLFLVRRSSFQALNSLEQLAQRQCGRSRRSCDRASRTAAASSRSRLPPQVEHSTSSTRCSSLLRKAGDKPRGFFERRIEPLELKAEQRPFVFLALAVGEDVDPLLARAVQHDPPLLGVELIERHVERHAACAPTAPRASSSNSGVLGRGHKPTAPLGQRQLRIAQQGRRIRAGLRAQAFARRAPAERAVERKTVRRERLEAAAALSQAKCWL